MFDGRLPECMFEITKEIEWPKSQNTLMAVICSEYLADASILGGRFFFSQYKRRGRKI